MNEIKNRFQVEELEERLEMAKANSGWTLSMTINSDGSGSVTVSKSF